MLGILGKRSIYKTQISQKFKINSSIIIINQSVNEKLYVLYVAL